MADYTGAAGVFYYKDGGRTYVLVGKESRHLRDYVALPDGPHKNPRTIIHPATHEPCTDATLKAYETLAESSIENAYIEFARRCRALSRLNHITIRHDLPRVVATHEGVNIYKVRYRMLFAVPANGRTPELPIQYGVIKGKRETGDANALATLKRELLEEVGVDYDIVDPVYTHAIYTTQTYYVRLSNADVNRFTREMRDQNASSYGELYGLKFMELHALDAANKNSITKRIVNHLLAHPDM